MCNVKSVKCRKIAQKVSEKKEGTVLMFFVVLMYSTGLQVPKKGKLVMFDVSRVMSVKKGNKCANKGY